MARIKSKFINSEAATNGQALVADGAGKASWQTVTASASAGGVNGNVQYNNAGAIAGAADVSVVSGDLTFVPYDGTTPAVPTNAVLFNKKLAGRHMMSQIGPSGIDYSYQPLMSRNKIGIWTPPGNATTVPGVFGMSAFTAVGTATARNVATTRFATRLRRLGFVSAATAGSLASIRLPAAQFTTGDGGIPSAAGFFCSWRFIISDAAAVSGARMFTGITSSTAAPTNVEPSTLTNIIGVGHGAADTNLKVYYGAGTAATPIDLTNAFPTNTLSTEVFEVNLFAPPQTSLTCYYDIIRLNTGDRASGILQSNLPASTVLLGWNCWRCNNATALAVGFDLCNFYIETDN